MMYTINPLPPIEPSHPLFIFSMIVGCIVLVLACEVAETPLDWINGICRGIIIIFFGWLISYHTGDQTVQYYKNEAVQGKFEKYYTEGYSTSEHNGKSTRQVEHHMIYVSYNIDGKSVLFPATTGTEYPPVGIFYKN